MAGSWLNVALPLHVVVHESLRFEGLNDIADSKIRDGMYHVMAVSLVAASNAPYTNSPYSVYALCGPMLQGHWYYVFTTASSLFISRASCFNILPHAALCDLSHGALRLFIFNFKSKRIIFIPLSVFPTVLLFCTWNAHTNLAVTFSDFSTVFFFLYFKGNHTRMPLRRKFEVIILSDKYRLSLPVAISLCVWAIVWVSYVNTIMNR